MLKKIIIGVVIAAIILISSGGILYAYPKEHPNKGNQKNLDIKNETNFKNNKNTINITINGYSINILPPLGINNQKAFKIGRIIPVKFILTDENGNVVENMSIRLYLAKVENNVAGSEIQATSPGKSNDNNYFRFNKTSKRYLFNLSTKGLSTGMWRLKIDLGNGTVFNTDIIMR